MTMAPVIIRNMVQVAVQTWGAATLPVKIMVPVIIRNMVQVVVQIFGAVTLPVLKVLIRPAAGLLDKAAIHQKGGGEISDIGSLDPTAHGLMASTIGSCACARVRL
jgi:hypothetical protein